MDLNYIQNYNYGYNNVKEIFMDINYVFHVRVMLDWGNYNLDSINLSILNINKKIHYKMPP